MVRVFTLVIHTVWRCNPGDATVSVMALKKASSSFGAGEIQSIRLASGPRPVHIRLVGRPFTYEVRVTTRGQRPELVDLRVVPDEGTVLSSEALRGIPVVRLAAAAAQWVVFPQDQPDTAEAKEIEFDWRTFRKPEKPIPVKRPGRSGWPDEHYREVAALAKAARDRGMSARSAIAERWGRPEATADKWMMTARRKGFLEVHSGPAPRGTRKVKGGASAATGSGEVAS